MSKIIRTEEWQREEHGMISTALLDVYEGEVVRLSPELTREMRLDPAQGREIVPEGQEHFVNEFPYQLFKSELLRTGMTYAGTT